MLGSSKVQRKTGRKEKNNLVETVLVQTVLVAFWNGASWKSPFSKTSTSACLDCSRRSQEDRSFVTTSKIKMRATVVAAGVLAWTGSAQVPQHAI